MDKISDVELFGVELKATDAKRQGVISHVEVKPDTVLSMVKELTEYRKQRSSCECGGMMIYNQHSPLCEHYRMVVAGERSDFDMVGDFFQKFGMVNVTYEGAQPRFISDDLVTFRLKCLHEELAELHEGYDSKDLAKIADALVDLVYFALGTAHSHGLPWAELFAAVQRANMTKERSGIDHGFVPCDHHGECALMSSENGQLTVTGGESLCHHRSGELGDVLDCSKPAWKHSKRGNAIDIIKPPDWKEPDIAGILKEAGYTGDK